MRSDAFERLRAQNPLPQLLPNAPIEPLLRRVDAERSSRPARIPRELADAHPVAATYPVTGEAERVLRRPLADGHAHRRPTAAEKGPRRPWAIALGVLSVLVVAAVVVIATTAIHHGSRVSEPAAGGRIVTFVYHVQPTPRAPRVTRAAIRREIAVIHARLPGEPVHATVQRLGADEIRLGLSGSHLTDAELSAIEQRATATGSLAFYDWEGDALLPDGTTVASQLPSHNPRAVQISQGDSATPPGAVGAMSLYRAVTLASEQSAAPGGHRLGPVYYLFGAPGSKACTTAAADRQTRPIAGAHCYLSGPVSDPSLPSPLPSGVRPSAGTWIGVPQGTVVISAAPNQSGVASPSRFFVLRDGMTLTNDDITHPQVVKTAGEDEVELRLTKQGARAFQNLTERVAHRGQEMSVGSDHLFQHIAIGLDNRLIEVAQIDFARYPFGVTAKTNESISIVTANVRQARQLAAILRAGALPLSLIQTGRGG
jgi:hypothetical protein